MRCLNPTGGSPHQGLERKQQLLDARRRACSPSGATPRRGSSTSCRAAGVAKGLFYWYFDTKEALFRDLAADLAAGCGGARPGPGPGRRPARAAAPGSEASVRFMAEHAQAFALIAVENVEQEFVEDLRAGTEIHADDVERVLRRAVDDGLVRDEDPRLLAYAVLDHRGVVHPPAAHRADRPRHRRPRRLRRPPGGVQRRRAASEEIARSTMESPAAAVAFLDGGHQLGHRAEVEGVAEHHDEVVGAGVDGQASQSSTSSGLMALPCARRHLRPADLVAPLVEDGVLVGEVLRRPEAVPTVGMLTTGAA